MTDLRDFYKNKNIFITGATGFVGICLLEKLVRTIPEHGTIYLLMRPKRGKQINERLEELKRNPIFELALKGKSVDQVFSKVKTIAGDVGEEDLGVSKEDRRSLIENLHVIIHSAATLDFGNTLKNTISINLLGTRRITQLASECPKLEALVHVSSAYVNSWRLDADEIVYPLPMTAESLLALASELSAKDLEKKTPHILGNHPNAYTFTKHMAEHQVLKIEQKVPCAIVRPSMIVGAWKKPVPGWSVSKNGPQGFFMGASKGVIRRLPVGRNLVYDYIPVDIVVNNLLTAGFYVGSQKLKTASVFHCTTSTRNPFRWRAVEPMINENLHKYPLTSAVWYPHLKLLPSIAWFKISAIFVHIIPGFFLDILVRLTGGRPILMKLHRNINASLDQLSKFIFTEWKFSATKTTALQEWLRNGDREDFNLDVSTLEWSQYFDDLALGARVYLSKDPIETLNAAKRKQNLLYAMHLVWQGLLLLTLWFSYACIVGTTLYGSAYILLVLLGLNNLL